MRLSDLIPGTPFVVTRVLVGGEIGKRLADMGFTDGAGGLLVRGAFMRGPIQVRIRDYDLLIRRGEAKLIEVAMESGANLDGHAGSGGAAGSGGTGWKSA
ncbi:MAG: FeoA family protein [Rectinemataceae bacterium]|nr:FeoA family protein [Rectinemataceae bacterium]